MQRRELFNLHYLAHAAGETIAADAALADDVPLLRFTRRAMATQFEILLPFGTPDALAVADAAFDEICRLEDQLTVYHETSEVSRLNRDAFDRPIRVEDRLFVLLVLASRLSSETSGAFDITAGSLIKTWGFFRRQGRVPSADELAEAMQRAGMHYLDLDSTRRTVRYRKRGMEINLGSIGKGYALDRAAEVLRGAGITSALLHGGLSSVLAVGSLPGDRGGWPVGIANPADPERRLMVVRLSNRAIGTSSATFQNLEYNGRKLGHIIDPRTGWPAEGVASASAIATTAADADALATAFFILGAEGARRYCEKHPGTAAVVLPDKTPAPITMGLR